MYGSRDSDSVESRALGKVRRLELVGSSHAATASTRRGGRSFKRRMRQGGPSWRSGACSPDPRKTIGRLTVRQKSTQGAWASGRALAQRYGRRGKLVSRRGLAAVGGSGRLLAEPSNATALERRETQAIKTQGAWALAQSRASLPGLASHHGCAACWAGTQDPGRLVQRARCPLPARRRSRWGAFPELDRARAAPVGPRSVLWGDRQSESPQSIGITEMWCSTQRFPS